MSIKNNQEIDGVLLFFRWVCEPCSQLRFRERKIQNKDFRFLKYLARSGGKPSLDLIEKCFGDAFKSYMSFVKTEKGLGVGKPWEISSVKEYFHHNHFHINDAHSRQSDVDIAQVMHLDAGAIIVSIDTNKDKKGKKENFIQIPVENCYCIPVKIGDKVYLHKHVFVEIADESQTGDQMG